MYTRRRIFGVSLDGDGKVAVGEPGRGAGLGPPRARDGGRDARAAGRDRHAGPQGPSTGGEGDLRGEAPFQGLLGREGVFQRPALIRRRATFSRLFHDFE